jgi:hypothetical protein
MMRSFSEILDATITFSTKFCIFYILGLTHETTTVLDTNKKQHAQGLAGKLVEGFSCHILEH